MAGSVHVRTLSVIGVHTPEFSFQHALANVRRAIVFRQIDDPGAEAYVLTFD